MSKFRKGLRSRKSRSEVRIAAHNNVTNNNIIDPVTGEPENDMPKNIDIPNVQSGIEPIEQNSQANLNEGKENLDSENSITETVESGISLKEKARFALNQQSSEFSQIDFAAGSYNQELENLFNNDLPYDLRRKDNVDNLSYLSKLKDELPKPTIVPPHEDNTQQVVASSRLQSPIVDKANERSDDSLPKALRKDKDIVSIPSKEEDDYLSYDKEKSEVAFDGNFSAQSGDVFNTYNPDKTFNGEDSIKKEILQDNAFNEDTTSLTNTLQGEIENSDTNLDSYENSILDTKLETENVSEDNFNPKHNIDLDETNNFSKDSVDSDNSYFNEGVSLEDEYKSLSENDKEILENTAPAENYGPDLSIVNENLTDGEKEVNYLSDPQFRPANDVPQKTLEDTFVPHAQSDNSLDDPDRVPVVPTLSDDEVPNRPGAILMHARELLGLSVREVANKLQLRVNTVSDIEHDRLNQPTAVPFASVHIGNYARLVNIDARTLVELYKKNVFEQANSIRRLNKKTHKKRGPLLLLTLGVILVLGGAYAAYKFYPSSEEGKVGALTLNNDVTSSIDESGVLNLNTKEEPRTEIKDVSSQNVNVVSDPNTQKARQQALDLELGDSIFDNSKDFKVSQDTPALVISDEKTSLEREVKGDVSIADKDKNSLAEVKTKEDKLKDLANNTEATSNNTFKVVDTKLEEKTEENKPAETLKKDQEPEKALEKEEPPKPQIKLGRTRNISQVSIKNRVGLGLLNNVHVIVKGDVALRITHHNGSVLKEGVFKAGDKLDLKGIPPFKVYVSDSSKVRIEYMGGTVAVPNTTNVNFELPTK